MRVLWILVSVAMASGTLSWVQAQPQTGKFEHGAGKGPEGLDTKPLTREEFSEVLFKVETAIHRVVFRVKKTPTKIAGGAAPVQTEAIASEMGRLFSLSKGKFKFTPPMIAFDKSVLSLKSGTSARRHLETLVRWGFVGRVSPLATSKTQTLNPHEFGDALGLFLARLAELTHTPSSEWSPYMNWHKEG